MAEAYSCRPSALLADLEAAAIDVDIFLAAHQHMKYLSATMPQEK